MHVWCPHDRRHFRQANAIGRSSKTVREFLEKNGVSCWENPNGSDEDKVLDCKIAAAPLIQAFEENYRKVQIKGAV